MLSNLFFLCAVTGGTFLVCQFVLMIAGIGIHDFMGADSPEAEVPLSDHAGTASEVTHQHLSTHHGGWLFTMFSIRTVSAAITFFGLAGMAAAASELSPLPQLGIAIAAGGLALVCVYRLVLLVRCSGWDQTVKIQRIVGQSATVYLPIPAAGAGAGKVFVQAQNRQMEYPATTAANRVLLAGEQVIVIDFKGITLLVAPDPSLKSKT